MAILISDKIYFKIRNITRDKDRNYIMTKRSIPLKEITILNAYAPDNRSSNCTKQKPNKTKRRDFPGGAVVKNPPANEGDMGSSPGPGRSHMLRSN